MAVKSAERVLRIFDLLTDYPDGLSNKEISEKLGYAPSSTIGLVKTLKMEGYLETGIHKTYRLGGKLVHLGNIAASYMDINELSAPVLKELMTSLGETCFVGVLSKDEVVYIAKARSNYTINTNADIGSRKPIYCTGLGKAFLSFVDTKESEKLMEGIEFRQYTDKTVKNSSELKKQINYFKKQGYAVDDEEIEAGLWCLAVPVYNGNGRMIAAISTSGPRTRMLEKVELIKKEMLTASDVLSKKMGYFRRYN